MTSRSLEGSLSSKNACGRRAPSIAREVEEPIDVSCGVSMINAQDKKPYMI
jgi:hypothetical protein